MDRQEVLNRIQNALAMSDMKKVKVSDRVGFTKDQNLYYNFVKGSFYIAYVAEDEMETPQKMREFIMPFVENMQSQADRIFFLTIILREETQGEYRKNTYPEPNPEDAFIPIYWEVDICKAKLRIPENQPSSFLHLENALEKYITQENVSVYEIQETKKKPLLSALLVAIIAMVWLVFILPADDLIQTMLMLGATQSTLIVQGEWYRMFASIFLHFDANHLLMNAAGLFIFGSRLERTIKEWEYLLIFVGGGVAGNVAGLLAEIYQQNQNTVGAGASGGVYALLGAVLTLSIFTGKKIGGFSSYSLAIYLIWSIISSMGNTQINHIAHIGGFIWGFAVAIPMVKRRKKEIQQ